MTLYRFTHNGHTYTAPANVILDEWIYISWLHRWFGPRQYETNPVLEPSPRLAARGEAGRTPDTGEFQKLLDAVKALIESDSHWKTCRQCTPYHACETHQCLFWRKFGEVKEAYNATIGVS